MAWPQVQISQWKRQLLKQVPELFGRTVPDIDPDDLTAPLYQEIGRLKMELDWLKKYGDFENGVPSHHTIASVAAVINTKQFQRCFIDWMKACHKVTNGEIIAIDGKTLRGSYDKSNDKAAIHMVSAFAAANELVFGKIKVALFEFRTAELPFAEKISHRQR